MPTGEPTPVSQEEECVNTSDKGIPAPRGALEAAMTNKKRITDTRQEKLLTGLMGELATENYPHISVICPRYQNEMGKTFSAAKGT